MYFVDFEKIGIFFDNSALLPIFAVPLPGASCAHTIIIERFSLKTDLNLYYRYYLGCGVSLFAKKEF